LHPIVRIDRRNKLATSTPDPTPGDDQSRKAVRGHILFCIGVLLALYIAWHLAKELEIIYVSALFAVVLSPVVDRITQLEFRGHRASRGIAIAILIAATLLALSLFFTFGLPPVLRDLRQFSTELPERVSDVIQRINRYPIASRLNIDVLIQRTENALTASATYLFTSLPGWLSHVFDILAAAFLCIYFMLEGEYAYRFFLSLFPYRDRARLDATLRRADLKISKWLFGQGLLMLILGVSSTIVFGILHVRYFLLLGLLMGLFNIIPIAGGIFTIILSAGVAALDSWTKMAGVLIFYAIYINIENAYLTPRIMRSSVNLMGLTVLISLLCGTALAGITGALVAVPTAALISVLLEEYAVQKEWR
jgi:predicted PurR-regulated permease PerM